MNKEKNFNEAGREAQVGVRTQRLSVDISCQTARDSQDIEEYEGDVMSQLMSLLNSGN